MKHLDQHFLSTALTINDYANNSKPLRQLSKVHLATKNVDVRAQTEKCAGDATAINDDHLDIHISRKSRKKTTTEDENQQYASYHDDVWFAISRYVAAEDVRRFALINRQTADVCRSASFWAHLYRREYRPTDGMPERLRPECMMRLGGLRTCTIRALFYCNATLRNRLSAAAALSVSASGCTTSIFDLVRRECVGAWTVADEKTASWWHCYRLKRRLPVDSRMATSEALRKRNVFERMYRDIYQNPDESCTLLAVRMTAVRPLPQLFGQATFLAEVRHNLSGRGCAEYRMSMTFGTGCGGADVLAQVVYDPVAEMRVLDWWTPAYHEFVALGVAEAEAEALRTWE